MIEGTKSTAESDRPLTDPADDRLGRRTFAMHVARVLRREGDADPIVVGLYGEWGSGKTSVLNFVEGQLAGGGGCVVVRYNPWFFSGEEQLLDHFLGHLASAIGASSEPPRQEAASAIRKYLRILKPTAKLASVVANVVAPGAGTAADLAFQLVSPTVSSTVDIGESFAEGLDREQESLEDTRDRLSASLLRAGVRVVVFVDDIDRLSPIDLRMVFKLVRLVGDLPYVSYILALDPHVVSRQLGSGIEAVEPDAEGRAYLEKIVQVALPVPKVRKEDLRQIAFDGINALLGRLQLELSRDEATRFVSAWASGIEPSVHTVRQAKRLLNAVDSGLSMLRDEVNAVDVMLWEALRIVHPHLTDFITSNPGRVLEPPTQGTRRGDDTTWISEALGNTSGTQTRGVEKVLHDLFPRLRGHQGDGFEIRSRKEARICSKEHFEKLVGYGVPQGVISDVEYAKLLSLAGNPFPGPEFRRALAALTSTSWSDLIWRLRQDQQELSGEAAVRLALCVAEHAQELGHADGVLGNILPSSVNGALLSAEVVRRLPESQWVDAVHRIIATASSIVFAAAFLECLTRLHKDQVTPVGWEGLVDEARRAYVARLDAEARVPAVLLKLGRPSMSVFFQWREAIGVEQFDSLARQWFAADPRFLEQLLVLSFSSASQKEVPIPVRALSAGREYDNLCAVFDASDVATALGNDEYSFAEEVPSGNVGLGDFEQARLLFFAIHKERLAAAAVPKIDYSELEREVLDMAVDASFASGGPIGGLRIRARFRDAGRATIDTVLDRAVPRLLRRLGERPNDHYTPTLRGLLQSNQGETTRLVIDTVLRYLRDAVHSDAEIALTPSTLRSLPGFPEVDPQAMISILGIAELSSSGSSAGKPVTEFNYKGPADLEETILCEDTSSLLALREK